MVFITRYFARLARHCNAAFMAVLLLVGAYAHADGIEARKAVAHISENRIELSARFAVKLSPTLEQALQNGLQLPFLYEFELTRPRLYAWARQISNGFGPTATLTQSLSYQSLTRKYRVSSGGFSRSFVSLSEALSALGIISGWYVLPDSDLAENGKRFGGRLRLRLDLSQLPKPYQMGAIGQSEWHLDSPWAELAITASDEEGQP